MKNKMSNLITNYFKIDSTETDKNNEDKEQDL